MENSPLEGDLQHAQWQQRQTAKCAGKPVRKTALEENVKLAPNTVVRNLPSSCAASLAQKVPKTG